MTNRPIHVLLRALTALMLPFSIPSVAFAKEKPPKVSYDPYQKTTTIIGQIHDHNALLDLDKWSYWLSGSIVDGIAKNPTLLFSTDTPEWYFFERAADIDGSDLPVIQGAREIQLGGVHEVIGVELTPKYLVDHRSTGMNLKIMGSRGSKVLIVPGEVITAFEATYAAEVAKVGGFRNDLVEAQRAIAPTPMQIAQSNLSGADAAAAAGGYGISFIVLPQGIYLVAVAPNSRADVGHLKPGQLITAVNDKPIAGLSLPDVLALLKAAKGQTSFAVAGIGNLTVAP